MDEKNLRDLRDLYPEAEAKTLSLGSLLDPPVEEIADPYFLSPLQAPKVYKQMRQAVEALAEHWI